MDDIFASESIYKSLVICDTEETCLRVYQHLVNDDHMVAYISNDMMEDERPLFADKIRQFHHGSCRILLMTYNSWYQLIDMIEQYAMDHNLLVLNNLDTQEKYIITNWMMDAKNRGFAPRHDKYHVFFQDDAETFSPQDSV